MEVLQIIMVLDMLHKIKDIEIYHDVIVKFFLQKKIIQPK